MALLLLTTHHLALFSIFSATPSIVSGLPKKVSLISTKGNYFIAVVEGVKVYTWGAPEAQPYLGREGAMKKPMLVTLGGSGHNITNVTHVIAGKQLHISKSMWPPIVRV